MSKMSNIINTMKKPEFLATIAIGGSAIFAGKVLLDNCKAKSSCKKCCESDNEDAEDEDFDVFAEITPSESEEES